MESRDNWDQKQVLQDPEMLARLERNLRGAGMQRRHFLAMASAVAGAAALAACGGSSSPTATTAATVAPTKAPAAAAPTTAAPSAAAAATTAPAAATTAPAAAATTAPAASSAASTAAPAATTAAGSAVAGSPAAATGPESKKVFIDGADITSEPVDNDFNRDLYCGGVSQHMVGLLKYDQDFNLVPDLAESYTNAGAVFTFKIRKGATWSDGVAIKASDFVYSLRRQMDPRTANGYGSFWDSVIKGASDLSSAKADAANIDQVAQAVGVKAIDDSTLEITGDTFAGLIPNQAAYTATVIAREDIVKKYADAKGVSSWTDPGDWWPGSR